MKVNVICCNDTLITCVLGTIEQALAEMEIVKVQMHKAHCLTRGLNYKDKDVEEAYFYTHFFHLHEVKFIIMKEDGCRVQL